VGPSPSDPIGLAGKWVAYLALLFSVGLPIFAVAVLREAGPPRPSVAGLLGALLVAGGLSLLALAIRIPMSSGDPVVEYLVGSRTGLLAIARSALMVVGGLAVLAARGRGGRPLLLAAVTALLGISLHVAAGHAAASGSPVPVVVQVVHLVAAGTWLSGVVALAVLATVPAELVTGPAPSLRQLVPRFSAMGLAAIGLVSLTGLAAEWTQIGGLPSGDDAYGRALILKLIVVLAALTVGLFNYLDGGRDRGWLGGMRSRLFAEAGLGVAVLVVTALLSTTSPAANRGTALQPVPSALGEVQEAIGLSVLPARPGVN
jgi:putative copper export protein